MTASDLDGPPRATTAADRPRLGIDRETGVTLGALAALAAVAVWASLSGEPFVITLATKIAIFGLAAVGLNLALGYGGLVSLGHAAFFGIGGYAVGILSWHAQNYIPLELFGFEYAGTTSMPVLWLVAIVTGGAAAAVIGALSLRSSGIFFIMITLAFAQMIYYFAISWPAYGGEDGLPIYVRNAFPGLNTLDPLQFFAICFVFLSLGLWLVARLTASRFGLALLCAHYNEARLTSVGIAAYPVRLVAFTLSGVLTALAGALYADLNRFVSPDMLSWHMSGEFIVFVILGGVARLPGPLLGAALFILLEELLGGVTEYWKALFGLMLLGVVLYAPGGVMRVLAGEKRHG